MALVTWGQNIPAPCPRNELFYWYWMYIGRGRRWSTSVALNSASPFFVSLWKNSLNPVYCTGSAISYAAYESNFSHGWPHPSMFITTCTFCVGLIVDAFDTICFVNRCTMKTFGGSFFSTTRSFSVLIA